MDFQFKIKTTLSQNGESFFGPGVYTILKNVEKTGSLQSACREMGMAYSKGWRILRGAEKAFGKHLLTAKSGGANGGYSQLTQFAVTACKCYEQLCAAVNNSAQQLYENIKESLENEAD